MAEVERAAEKAEEEESPAEEESNSDEDEVIPDIGGPLAALPPAVPGHQFVSLPSPSGVPMLTRPPPPQLQGGPQPPAASCLPCHLSCLSPVPCVPPLPTSGH